MNSTGIRKEGGKGKKEGRKGRREEGNYRVSINIESQILNTTYMCSRTRPLRSLSFKT